MRNIFSVLTLSSLITILLWSCSSDKPIAIEAPLVDISQYSVISRDSVLVDYTVTGLEIISHGLKYSTDSVSIGQGQVVSALDGKVLLENLTYNTTYYVQAFASNVLGSSTSEVISFSTIGPAEVMVFNDLNSLNKYINKYPEPESEVLTLSIGGNLQIEDYIALGELGGQDARFPSLQGLILTDVDSIAGGAFNFEINKAYTWLQSISAPKATYIGAQAFENCALLTQFDFPKVTQIQTMSLYNVGATSFSNEQFPLVEVLQDDVFNSSKLISLVFPSLREIGNNLQNTLVVNHLELGLLDIPSKMLAFSDGIIELRENSFVHAQSIGDYAFAFCPNLKRAQFPSVREIGSFVFESSDNLTLLRFESDITSVATDAFEGFDTESCILILNEATMDQVDQNVWQGKKWKSIFTL